MEFRTIVNIDRGEFVIPPCERMLFVGSCFADNIGQRFVEEKFRATVNPFGVMYNPASILHTVQKTDETPHVAVLTLGTNHVYILNETGEIVDNCQKRPQRLFQEKVLSMDECLDYLSRTVDILTERYKDVKIIVTVSPIRYSKYGFHGSQLSKATLLLATDMLCRKYPNIVAYFPAYEIVNDELRDYRFYKEDMLHPSEQAVEYIWQRFAETYFAPETFTFLDEWRPIREALGHKPFHPESAEYKMFQEKTKRQMAELARKYPELEF